VLILEVVSGNKSSDVPAEDMATSVSGCAEDRLLEALDGGLFVSGK